MLVEKKYASYLIRLWREQTPGKAPTCFGEVESVQTGQKWAFTSLRALHDFLQARIEGTYTDPARSGKETDDASIAGRRTDHEP